MPRQRHQSTDPSDTPVIVEPRTVHSRSRTDAGRERQRTSSDRVRGRATKKDGIAAAPVNPQTIAKWRETYNKYKTNSHNLATEIEELLLHMNRIGGEVTKDIEAEMEDTTTWIHVLDAALEAEINLGEQTESSRELSRCLVNLKLEVTKILDVLRRQKHSFRYLQRLNYLLQEIIKHTECTTYKKAVLLETYVPKLGNSFSNVKSDFRTFSDKTLPDFVNEEEERATTLYLSLTTIAIFFSSITATTLQFSYSQPTHLSSAVNLSWFLSLVFSISSGVNSLLSMVWRKSHIYSGRKTPSCIKVWLTRAPIGFLVISALAFITGLDLFVYSSHQMTYVATTTSICIALHVLGLLFILPWLVVQFWPTVIFKTIYRNICWVLLHDNNQIYRLNLEIAIARSWNYSSPSQPHIVLRLVRIVIQSIICAPCFCNKHRSRVLWNSRDIDLSDDDIHTTFFSLLSNVIEDHDCYERIEADIKGLKGMRCSARHIRRDGAYLLWGYPRLEKLLDRLVGKIERDNRHKKQSQAEVEFGQLRPSETIRTASIGPHLLTNPTSSAEEMVGQGIGAQNNTMQPLPSRKPTIGRSDADDRKKKKSDAPVQTVPTSSNFRGQHAEFTKQSPPPSIAAKVHDTRI